MSILVLQSFLLILAFVTFGIFLGAGSRVLFAGSRGTAASAGVIGHPPADEAEGAHANETALVAVVDAAVSDTESPAPQPVAPPEVPAREFVIDAARAAQADQTGIRPAALSSPRESRGDDLTLIKGIGPQNAARLSALGIYHFDQIAAWTPDEVRWVGSYLAFPGRIERENWIGQAVELAAKSGSGP